MFIRISKSGRVYLGDWDVSTQFYWVDGDPKTGLIVLKGHGTVRVIHGVYRNGKFYTNWAGE